MADQPDGRDYRDQQYLGIVPQAGGHGHSAWSATPIDTRRRPTARRHTRKPDCRAATPSDASGGCVRKKGSDVFVQAMCRLLPRYPDFAAVLVGAVTAEHTSFANDLKKRIEAAGLQSRIIITGELPIEEVQRWYQRLTIYAFTSRNEGFGLTLIEAMSAGAALVASRAGAAELVVEDGVTGVLMPPGDVDALVAALEPLMRDPAAAAQMGERARASVLEKFSLDAEAAGIAEVYRSLV